MIVKLKRENGYKIIEDVREIDTGYYDTELAIQRYGNTHDENIDILLKEGDPYYMKVSNADAEKLGHMLDAEFSKDEIMQGITKSFISLKEKNDYKTFTIVIVVKTGSSQNNYVTNQSIFLMNDQGETIERIN